MRKEIFLIALISLNVSCSVFGIRNTENPPSALLLKDKNFEIRQYDTYIVAEVPLETSDEGSSNSAFRRLAGYIFGGNSGDTKISMTAPVTRNENSEGKKISMTAPVFQGEQSGAAKMGFMIPLEHELDKLPAPDDSGIEFRIVPPRLIASIRFSGRPNSEKNQQKALELRKWILKKQNLEPQGSVNTAGYDPPWTLAIFRRNEIHQVIRTTDKTLYKWKHRLLVVSANTFKDQEFLQSFHRHRKKNQDRKLVLMESDISGYQLIGLDGEIKDSGNALPVLEEIYSKIDQMPMRKTETSH